jgi:hypothetical protein
MIDGEIDSMISQFLDAHWRIYDDIRDIPEMKQDCSKEDV